MGYVTLTLKAKKDFVDRLAQAQPLDALSELVWNSFDERATHVEVKFDLEDELVIKKIQVIDNGMSLRHSEAKAKFENLGDSDKVHRHLESGEPLHGSKGEGRHKALSLGDSVNWQFVYERDGTKWRYVVEGRAGNGSPFRLHDEVPAEPLDKVGCTVTVTEIHKPLNKLMNVDSKLRFTATFCDFLLKHPNRNLIYHDWVIKPEDMILTRKRLAAETVTRNGKEFTIELHAIRWKYGRQRNVQLCSSAGIPLHVISGKSLSIAPNFSIFASSPVFDLLHQENSLSNIEMTDDKSIVEKIKKRARKYLRDLTKRESKAALDRLKAEGSYPYLITPTSEIGQIEKRVFDLCTINISRHMPSFTENMDRESRTLLLRIVKEAISQSPTSVGKIIREVCKLPPKAADVFANLLDNTSLERVVNTSHLISQRLDFLDIFESLVYFRPFEKELKERTQLHRILAQNTWMFGEEYAQGTDDMPLKTVLEEHIAKLGRDHLAPEMRDADISALLDEYNKSVEKTNISLARIPDLMLWKKFVGRPADTYEYLVIEIKRPGVTLGRKELDQIEDYADAVASSEFAEMKKTRWVFLLVSDTLNDTAIRRSNQPNRPPYTVFEDPEKRYVIQAMPWNVIIRNARARHEYLKKELDYSLDQDEAIVRAKKRFGEYLPAEKQSKGSDVASSSTKRTKSKSGKAK